MAFCVECGREGPTIEALCPSCFSKKHAIVRAPTFVDVPRCVHCGSFRIGRLWTHDDLEAALPQVLQKAIWVAETADRFEFHHTARPLDPNTVDVTGTVVARFGEVDVSDEFRTRLRIRNAVCPTCSRERGSYYASILQVRADGRDLTVEEVRKVRAFVADAVANAKQEGEAFLSKTELVPGGIDFYLSSNALGRRIARGVREEFGGASGTAPKLHTRTAGRDVYRVTYLVRLPRLRPGQTVEFRGRRFTVKDVGRLVTLMSEDGGERRFRPRELRRAFPVDRSAHR